MSTEDYPIVLITGATGYIGSHIAKRTLEAGYPIRLTARPSKTKGLLNIYEGKAEIFAIEDLATGDYSEALRGVGAVIHVAAPNVGSGNPEQVLSGAIDGALNIVHQAIAANVKRIIVTSSTVTLHDCSNWGVLYSDKVLTENDWNPATKEDVLSGEHNDNPVWVYSAAKTVAEQELWKLADAHPEVDITAILPPYVYGPIAVGMLAAKGDTSSLSSADHFYRKILPADPSAVTLDREQQELMPMAIDVRDVALAHVLALRAPPASQVGRKRLLLAGQSLAWVDAVIHLHKVMPEIAHRLPKVAEGAESKKPLPAATVDSSRSEAILGLVQYIDWRKTVEDSVKTLLDMEKSWA